MLYFSVAFVLLIVVVVVGAATDPPDKQPKKDKLQKTLFSRDFGHLWGKGWQNNANKHKNKPFLSKILLSLS